MYYFRRADVQEIRDELFRLRHQVYCVEKQWFAPNEETWQEKDAFDDHSEFYAASDETGRIIGCLRHIFYAESLKLQICSHPSVTPDMDLTGCSEVSRFIVSPEFRTGSIILGLVRILYNYLLTEGSHIRYLYMAADGKLHRMMRQLGLDFRQIGPPGFCYGFYVVAARMNIAEMDEYTKASNPLYHSWLHRDPSWMSESDSLRQFIRDNRGKRPINGPAEALPTVCAAQPLSLTNLTESHN